MEKDINIHLMNMIRSIENIIKRAKHENSPSPSKQGYGRILHVLISSGKINQSELAEKLDIRPQSLTRILVDMEENGIIQRERDTVNRRNVYVMATEEGLKASCEFERRRGARAESVFGCLEEEEKKELDRLLTKVIQHSQKQEKGEDRNDKDI